MDADRARLLCALLREQEVAALGTLRQGEPFVSMVPYALLADGALALHVSRLAGHTRDMERHAGVSLLVTAARTPGEPPQGLARATLQGQAQFCAAGAQRHEEARAAYLARFPDSEPMFGFADFSLVLVVPRAVRVVGGFAQAWSVTGADYAALMSQAAPRP